ncbi:hypothetical protein LJK88_07245 [Paenibacillus sp. P26]|nr:hypothetical protein LJK88_07245 [Paenibacillus sp. P26]
MSKFRLPFEENGKLSELSAGQAANKMHSPDRAVRQWLFELWEKEWSEHADYCADALNRLGGFRLKLYERRGWDSVHKEPLAINRMSQETLDAMWGVIERGRISSLSTCSGRPSCSAWSGLAGTMWRRRSVRAASTTPTMKARS